MTLFKRMIRQSKLRHKTSHLILLSIVAFNVDVMAATQPDNTRVNQRDQSVNEVTAQDQGNSKTDIALTQKIRQQVIANKVFSTDARNIKIISINGQVYLKGPVDSASEKGQIEKIASSVAGTNKVISQLEVKARM